MNASLRFNFVPNLPSSTTSSKNNENTIEFFNKTQEHDFNSSAQMAYPQNSFNNTSH
jgi:hypothetical protein